MSECEGVLQAKPAKPEPVKCELVGKATGCSKLGVVLREAEAGLVSRRLVLH